MDDICLSPLLEVKRGALSDAGHFEGWASTFGGPPDSYGDVIAPGAFSATLRKHKSEGRMPAMLFSHDMAAPIGRWLDISEDSKGLRVVGKLTLGTKLGAEVRALMQDGAIALSIGFRACEFIRGTRPGAPRRTLTSIDLVEISAVALPANPRATVTAVKSAIDAPPQFSRADVERILRQGGVPQRMAKAIAESGFTGDYAADDTEETVLALKAAGKDFATLFTSRKG